MVFIHGEIHGMEYWDQQLADLSRDHRCLIYNRRGHAKTDGPTTASLCATRPAIWSS